MSRKHKKSRPAVVDRVSLHAIQRYEEVAGRSPPGADPSVRVLELLSRSRRTGTNIDGTQRWVCGKWVMFVRERVVTTVYNRDHPRTPGWCRNDKPPGRDGEAPPGGSSRSTGWCSDEE